MNVLGAVGVGCLALALLLLAHLGRQFGGAIQSPPYYIGIYVAVAIILLGALVQTITPALANNLTSVMDWSLLYNGLYALGVTLALVFTWRYWSWLLAERN